MNDKIMVTEEGKAQLEKELDELKLVKRPEIVERIKKARDFGDLSENAEYDAAKNEQARIEGRIAEIEATLKVAEIIDTNGKKGSVFVGSKVRILDIDLGEEEDYELVGTTEADIASGRISNESPLGQALVGAKEGEEVTVHAPQGDYKVKVLGITV